MGKVAGIILAGGKSSRMGTSKALLRYHGVCLIDHMRNVLMDAGIADVYISGIVPGYDGLPDRYAYQGPALAMRDLLSDFESRYARLLFIPVDMPLIGAQVLQDLLLAGGSVYYRDYPLPACLKTGLYAGDVRSVKSLLEICCAGALPLATGAQAGMANINTQQEWKAVSG